MTKDNRDYALKSNKCKKKVKKYKQHPTAQTGERNATKLWYLEYT